MISAFRAFSIDNNFQYDFAQVHAVTQLEQLSQVLCQQEEKPWFSSIFKKNTPIQSIYLYGRVGRGKTMLMDLFYQNIGIKAKRRIHFHRFMEEVHHQLSLCTGQSDPLKQIAEQWARKIKLLCFDEFFVSDIADAMLLSGLFQAFFQQGVVLVVTSNCKPEQLYRNGLQRERFLPTIDLINQYCQVLAVDGAVDHRLVHYSPTMAYRDFTFPLKENKYTLKNLFIEITGIKVKAGQLRVNSRAIPYEAKTDKVILFDFFALCAGPRSQLDYISLADSFDTILLDQVPQFQGERINAVTSGVEDDYQRNGKLLSKLRHLDDEARRFIALVDEFYDRKIRLIINAEVDIVQLYQGQQLSFEFARCQSRLIEMQTLSY